MNYCDIIDGLTGACTVKKAGQNMINTRPLNPLNFLNSPHLSTLLP